MKLHRLGGTEWQKQKTRVRAAVKDIAKELIQLYAQRMQQKGFAFPPDGEWQRDFEARFEFDETEDQLRCVNEIKDDMEREAPMGPPALRGRGLRQDRGGPAGGLQVRGRREAVRHPGAHHHPGLAALPDHLKADGGLPGGRGALVPVPHPQAAGGDSSGR